MRFQRIAATGSKLACVALELVGGLLLLLLPGLVGAAQLFANLLGTVLLDLEGQILKKKKRSKDTSRCGTMLQV